MNKRTAIFTGNFDPPHNGHMDIVRRVLETGDFDQVVVKVVPNPSKTRLLTEENSVAMLKKIMPADIAGRVIVDETDMSVGKLARKFDAAVVRGRRKAEHPEKDFVSEILIVGYLAGSGLGHLRRPVPIQWFRNTEQDQLFSSTKVRKILFSSDCSSKQLEELLPPEAARVLIAARKQCPQPFTQDSSPDFNKALARRLNKPKAAPMPKPGV
jgi:cytidyltransferase-like protein